MFSDAFPGKCNEIGAFPGNLDYIVFNTNCVTLYKVETILCKVYIM